MVGCFFFVVVVFSYFDLGAGKSKQRLIGPLHNDLYSLTGKLLKSILKSCAAKPSNRPSLYFRRRVLGKLNSPEEFEFSFLSVCLTSRPQGML